ncbi:hypothetical protein SEVCU012_2216 [Staphylococcus pettenkoferi VCU012]|nr:hypothetical protein SEVCU012_2216 [Staphylococcus pettenkoferi VCU012]
MDEVSLYKKHYEFHSKLDYVDTPNLSPIKEISKRINFASISTENQSNENKGNVYHRKKDDFAGDYINNLTLNYTIKPKEVGAVYGTISVKTTIENGEENKQAHFKYSKDNNYAKFIVDLISEKVIYSNELDSFIKLKNNQYEIIDNTNFALEYSIDKKYYINDFLDVMLEVYRNHLDTNYQYNIYPYAIAGNDWIYNCKELEFVDKKIN